MQMVVNANNKNKKKETNKKNMIVILLKSSSLPFSLTMIYFAKIVPRKEPKLVQDDTNTSNVVALQNRR